MQNTKSQKARKACGLIFLEGERLISDAIRSGLKAKALFVSKPELLAKLNLPKNFSTELYQVPYEKIQLWSELVTSPGLIGKRTTPSMVHLPLFQQCFNPIFRYL